MAAFDELIDDIENMPYESQEILIDKINKRFNERKRLRFIKETQESKEQYEGGNYSSGNSDKLFKALNK
jgi:hypothetical protein